MPQTVKQDGFAIEKAADGNEVRRQVFKGDVIPDHWKLAPSSKSGGKKATS